VGDGEVVQRTFGLRTPIVLGRDLDGPHAVGFGACAHPCSCEGAADIAGLVSRSVDHRTYGATRPPTTRRAAVWKSAVIAPWLRSMPRTIAVATVAGSSGLIAADTRAVSGGLVRFSRSSPGVRVSGGYTHDTVMPRCTYSARRVSASPRTAYFAGAY